MEKQKEKEIIARKTIRNNEEIIQTLSEHSNNVANLTELFAGKIGLSFIGKLSGLSHDYGKISKTCQDYLDGARPDLSRGDIDHSIIIAKFLNEYLCEKNKEFLINDSTEEKSKKIEIYERLIELLSVVMASHHGGLKDFITPSGKAFFFERLSKKEACLFPKFKEQCEDYRDNLQDIYESIATDLDKHNIMDKLIIKYNEKEDDFLTPFQNIFVKKELSSFLYGLLVKYLLSCLIDADRIDAADFECSALSKLRNCKKSNNNLEMWNSLSTKLKEHLINIKKTKGKNNKETNQLNKSIFELREFVSSVCIEKAVEEKGIFVIDSFTGSGKTISSFSFAINHAIKHCESNEKNKGIDRIIYVAPFISVLDQNAQVIREIFEEKSLENNEYTNNYIIECHSNLTPDEKNKTQELLSENWDSPIIFTTLVQFLESLFGHKLNSLRKMHNLANSIIIFDEIQSLPIKCTYMFNMAIRFLTKVCGATIVFCTATQPSLDSQSLEKSLRLCIDEKNIFFKNNQVYQEKFKDIKRFETVYKPNCEYEDIVSLAENQIKEETINSVLFITNTKKEARILFKTLKEKFNNYRKGPEKKEILIYHLSNNMCSSNKIDTLKEIKKALLEKNPVICISTSLIEAGVDIDFNVVARYIAGIDSIIQASGRCNRNGLMDGLGRFFIIGVKSSKRFIKKNIKSGKEVSFSVLHNEYHILSGSKTNVVIDNLESCLIDNYYKNYYESNPKELRFPIKTESGVNDNLLNLLSKNELSCNAYSASTEKIKNKRFYIRQSFETASENFRVIENNTFPIIVPYQEGGKKLIQEFMAMDGIKKENKSLKDTYDLYKRAQQYVVNVYENDINYYKAKGIITEISGTSIYVYIGDTEYYSYELGLVRAYQGD